MLGPQTRVLVVLSLLVASSSPFAGMRTLTWDPSPGAMGYQLYYGDNSASYDFVVDVGPTTQTTIDLDDCTRWFFAVTAYNNAGESGFSEEVDWLTPMSVDNLRTDNPGESIVQGYQGAVTITGARFEPGAVVELSHPGWSCPASATPAQCQESMDRLRAAVRLENPAVQDCNTLTAWAAFEPASPGAQAATVGEYTLTATNLDGSSASLNNAIEIDLDVTRVDIAKGLAWPTWTENRIDGLDPGPIQLQTPLDQPCDCCSEAICADFDHDVDIDGDGWIDGDDLALLTPVYSKCWDSNSKDWTFQACRTHPSELNPQ